MKNVINKLGSLCLSFILALFFISAAIKGTLAFKQLYYFDINNLNIAEGYGMEKEEIIKNYDILIDYIQNKNIKKLSMPSFPMSKQGEIHFIEVKNIFMKFNTLFYTTGLISILGIFVKIRNKSFSFLKWSSIELLALPIVLSIPFAINFDKSFTIFHKIFFNNNYWEFDLVSDPIINVLPQEFFFHCAVLILALTALSSLILYLTYRKLKKHKRNCYRNDGFR